MTYLYNAFSLDSGIYLLLLWLNGGLQLKNQTETGFPKKWTKSDR